jgi:transcriptional regulator with XRE-family HTH domain
LEVIYLSLGERIRKYRKINKFTQKQLSSQLGLTPKMISFYERNERIPPIDIIIKLSEIFSVSTDYLLGLSPEQSIPNTQTSLSSEEKEIINLYRSLDRDYKDIILGELKKWKKLQKLEHKNKLTKREA